MQSINLNLSKAYSSQYDEITSDSLPIYGKIPTWLNGSFVSNGPAQFEVGSTQFKHWFDGFAMLKKFDFKSGQVRFQNRFLQSKEYVESNKLGKLNDNDFGTYASNSVLGRILNSIKGFVKETSHSNCVVNTARIAEDFIAMTETNALVSFAMSDLSTIGSYHFVNNIPGHISTAHPHVDTNTGELINVATEIGKVFKYHIYTIDPVTKRCKIIHTYTSDSLFYMHSFSISKNYVILFKSPLIINQWKLLLGLPFNHALSYRKAFSSFFVIIDRRNGQHHEIETDPFVCLHSVNCYEMKNDIVLDLVCYESGNPYDSFYLSNLRSSNAILPTADIRRYVINLQSKNCKQSPLSSNANEFPRINYEVCNGKDYQFVYTSMKNNSTNLFFNAIQKLNVRTGNTQYWDKTDYYVGEPVFVAKPNSPLEDEGVLLSIAFNAVTQVSSLVIIDALSMQLVAEVFLPVHMPFGLHGNFYN